MKKIVFLFFIISAVNSFSQNVRSVVMDDVVKIIDSSDSPLVINFWATWCKPCIEEISFMEKQAGLNKVKLILVSLDFKEDYPANIKKFVAQNKYTSEILWLSETDADSFCPKIDKRWEGALPATLFVNRNKNYRNFVGVQMSEEEFKAELKKLF